MKKQVLSLICVLFLVLQSKAQVISIRPDTAQRGQSLTTTITVASGVMFNASAPGSYQDIYLEQGATKIYVDPSYNATTNWYNYWDPWSGTYIFSDSCSVIFNIPFNVPNGYYNVVVNTYQNPWWIPIPNILTNGFFIGTPAGTAKGVVYFDVNQDGIQDVGEPLVANQQILITPGNSIAYTNSYGEFTYYADTGTYTLDYLPIAPFTQTSPTQTYNVTIPPSVTGKDFGTYSSANLYSNYAFISRTRIRCNQTARVVINFNNDGYLTVQDRVTLITSSNLVFNSATVPPDVASGDTLTWTYQNVGGMTSNILGGVLLFTSPAAGQTISITLIDSVFDLGGNFLEVNTDFYLAIIACSYDPNEKTVSPIGSLSHHYTPINSDLTYLINFQNTGNDTAYDVFIFDTLNSNLDLSTFEVIGSSHEISTQMTASGAVRFNFFNIMLPDSGADLDGSHGWVLYKIHPNAGLPNPTVITNTSYIVFDQNAPIITNTTMNTMTALQYPEANFSTADVTICETDCITFSNQSTFGTSYEWSFAGGSPSSSTSASPGSICYSTSGSFNVSLITTNALGSDTLIQSSYINVAPSPGVFTVTQTAGDSLIAPLGYASYQWYYNNVLIGGATSNYYVATQNGDYGIVVGNANGCMSGVNISNFILGIDNFLTDKAISIYPNPTSGEFEISFVSKDDQDMLISFYDKVGQLVQSRTVQTINGANRITMNEENLSAGIYMIQLTGTTNVITKMLMVNK